MALHPVNQLSRALHVIDNPAAGLLLQDIRGEEHHLAVGINNLTLAAHHPKAVAVTVKRQTHLRVRRLQPLNQLLKILRLRRIPDDDWGSDRPLP